MFLETLKNDINYVKEVSNPKTKDEQTLMRKIYGENIIDLELQSGFELTISQFLSIFAVITLVEFGIEYWNGLIIFAFY